MNDGNGIILCAFLIDFAPIQSEQFSTPIKFAFKQKQKLNTPSSSPTNKQLERVQDLTEKEQVPVLLVVPL
jgi:hypothetical protein